MSQIQWPRGLMRGYLAVRLLGLWARIPPGYGYLSVSCEFVYCHVDVSVTG